MWSGWGLKTVLIVFALVIGIVMGTTTQHFRPNIGPWGIKFQERGFDYPASLVAALTSSALQNDMVQRGLVALGIKVDDTEVTTVDTGGIQNLINQGIYFLDPMNILQLGPVPLPEGFLQTQPGSYYIYALRLTQALSILDDFNYIGHSVYVTIPDNFNLPSDSKTTHNLYNIHLTLPDGKWVESGVGWVTWTTSPIIYTYQSYTGKWSFASIPSGARRDILLKVEIGADQVAEMYVFDPLSGKSVITQQKVNALGHRLDEAQEQASQSNQWTSTPVTRFHTSQIKRVGSTSWEDWSGNAVTTWSHTPPMSQQRGEDGGKIWTETWCDTSQVK